MCVFLFSSFRTKYDTLITLSQQCAMLNTARIHLNIKWDFPNKYSDVERVAMSQENQDV